MYFASRKLGDTIFCPCSCPGLYGETINLTVSGIVPCGCITGEGELGSFEYTIFDLPAEWVLEYDSGTGTWIQSGRGSWEIRTGPNCGELTQSDYGAFSFYAQCLGNQLQILASADATVLPGGLLFFTAHFDAPGTSQPNIILCGSGTGIGEGFATI